MRFDALLRAHAFMKVERPPEIWDADTEDVRFLPLLGEMIAAGLGRGAVLGELILNVSNVVVDASGDEDETCGPRPGDYVAVTVIGDVDLGPDDVWDGASRSGAGLLADLHERLVTAGALYGYVRHLPARGSITIFMRRLLDANPCHDT